MAQITAGIKLYYKVEITSGVIPAGHANTWTAIPSITEMPEIGGAPDSIETTTLDNLTYKTYANGLLDVGGALAFKANDSAEFRLAIKTMLTAQAGLTNGLKLWFAIDIPTGVGKYLAFQGVASPIGFGGAGINALLSTTLNVTPTGEPEWYPLV